MCCSIHHPPIFQISAICPGVSFFLPADLIFLWIWWLRVSVFPTKTEGHVPQSPELPKPGHHSTPASRRQRTALQHHPQSPMPGDEKVRDFAGPKGTPAPGIGFRIMVCGGGLNTVVKIPVHTLAEMWAPNQLFLTLGLKIWQPTTCPQRCLTGVPETGRSREITMLIALAFSGNWRDWKYSGKLWWSFNTFLKYTGAWGK